MFGRYFLFFMEEILTDNFPEEFDDDLELDFRRVMLWIHANFAGFKSNVDIPPYVGDKRQLLSDYRILKGMNLSLREYLKEKKIKYYVSQNREETLHNLGRSTENHNEDKNEGEMSEQENDVHQSIDNPTLPESDDDSIYIPSKPEKDERTKKSRRKTRNSRQIHEETDSHFIHIKTRNKPHKKYNFEEEEEIKDKDFGLNQTSKKKASNKTDKRANTTFNKKLDKRFENEGDFENDEKSIDKIDKIHEKNDKTHEKYNEIDENVHERSEKKKKTKIDNNLELNAKTNHDNENKNDKEKIEAPLLKKTRPTIHLTPTKKSQHHNTDEKKPLPDESHEDSDPYPQEPEYIANEDEDPQPLPNQKELFEYLEEAHRKTDIIYLPGEFDVPDFEFDEEDIVPLEYFYEIDEKNKRPKNSLFPLKNSK
ncbi:hypothetical protein TRFO_13536 [Tritrichomonas foetus]|uniref:Uncharacterized protein n=1 Tax=Tritrichomonas foetus TaxID=1144522 RepID=A0A1J4KXR2_9EUKA|nr:hypothetical protein TRFO_13536 [Tritrichomonas foetus]|eukprot:OHT16043.1 hypothetical protein TRFO_13536 [Tritrichomonas foetus]